MFFNSKFKTFVGILVSILVHFTSTNCNLKFIKLRIYPPIQSKTYSEIPFNKNIIFEDKVSLGETLGRHNPFVFKSRNLNNEYGSLVYLLENEIQNYPERYPKVHSSKSTLIRITEYNLKTDDSCWDNNTSVDFKAEVEQDGKIELFNYSDSIHSHITDCFLIGSTITFLPLLIYIPYEGYRGTREDQLNQLGRNSLDAFLAFLNQKEYKPYFKKYNPQKSSEDANK